MRPYAGLAALVGWFAFVLQLVLMLTAPAETSAAARLVNFFSYFTILSNLLVAAVLTASALGSRGVLARPAVLAAAALYIAIVGLLYFFLLRMVWDPQGWQWLADALLHYVMPLLYVVFWLVFAPKGKLRPAHLGWFLVFPLLFVGYSLARGSIVGWYPYYFIDAGQLGYGQVLLNAVMLTAVFLVGGAIVLVLDRWLGRSAQRRVASA